MNTAYLVRSIFLWHYGQALSDMFTIWGSFLKTAVRIFSVKDLLKTLFSPWERLSESYKSAPGTVDFHQMAAAFVVNMMMRFVGFFVRSIFLIFFLLIFLFLLFMGTLIVLTWLFLPVVIIGSLSFGVALVIF